LPELSVQFGVGFSGTQGLVLGWERRDLRAEITALQNAMKGATRSTCHTGTPAVPGDAERYYRLGQLYREMANESGAQAMLADQKSGREEGARVVFGGGRVRDFPRSQEAFAQSVALYRFRAKSQPRNGRLLAQFGEALSAAKKEMEAERVLRQAVKVAPREWRAWVALGRFLADRSFAALQSGEFAPMETVSVGSVLDQWERYLRKKPSPAQIDRSQRLVKEAGRCFDRAVTVAPREPQPYTERATFRISQAGLQVGLRVLHGEPADPTAATAAAVLSPGALADLQAAARWSPNDIRAIGVAIFFELLAAAIQSGQEMAPDIEELWDTLPDKTKASVREAKARLEKLGRNGERRTAVGAATLLGMLQLIMQDSAGAEASLRRAITLDPSRAPAWDLLAVLMTRAERREEDLFAFCTEVLRRRDGVPGRLTLARAYEESDQLREAAEQVQAALRLKPDDFTANVALALLLMKRNEDPAAVAQAGKLLDEAGRALGSASPPDERARYALAWGIYYGRIGDLPKARQALLQAREAEGANPASR
jgi:tetratricopeptide (TPR) repeat protein